MPPPVTVEILDRMRPNLASLVMERARRLPGMVYCDLRLQVKEEKSAVAENGNAKASGEDYVFDFGVRVIAGARLSAPGYFGRVLGAADTANIEEVVWDGIRQAHQRARTNARLKSQAKGRFSSLGGSLGGTDLAPVAVVQDSVPATYTLDPRGLPLSETVSMAVEGCKAAQGQSGPRSERQHRLRRRFDQHFPAPGVVSQLRRGGHRPVLRSNRGVRHRHLRERAR